ncbi:MAG: XRE family transcriptional regulator [Alcanivorax sp.]|jgi:transcriptional regulator with XRE-family HTH domain|nr:MAG: XRE family transcriptional regulator [Alcanivorax sp.]
MSTLERLKRRLSDTFSYEFEKAKVSIVASLTEIMKRHQLSQGDIARAMGVSEPQVSKILRADQNLTLKTMVSLARATNSKLEVRYVEKATESKQVYLGCDERSAISEEVLNRKNWSKSYMKLLSDFAPDDTVHFGKVMNCEGCNNDNQYPSSSIEAG